MYKSITSLLCFSLLVASSLSWSQNSNTGIVNGPFYVEGARDYYKVRDIPSPAKLARQSDMVAKMSGARNACSTINTTYTNFPNTAAETAFEFAAEIWENSIESNIPITISAQFETLNSEISAFAEPNGFFTIGTGVPDTLYPRALAELLTGAEIEGPNSVDILISFSDSESFYYGLDANPPGDQLDFVTVVLHQIAHGLGFIGFGVSDGTTGSIRDGVSGLPSIFDRFIENGSGTAILDFSDPSTVLHSELTGNNLFCNSSLASAENGGSEPRIYSPDPFVFFESYDHWDPTEFPSGNINALMTPTISNGEANHNIGPVTLGFIEDMGWAICQTLGIEDRILSNFNIVENPVTDVLKISFEAQATGSDLNLQIYNIEGKQVMNSDYKIENSSLSVPGISQLKDGVYFVKLRLKSTDQTITRKFIKQ